MKVSDPRRRVFLLNNYYWEMRAQQKPEIFFSLAKLFSLFPETILRVISGYNMGCSIGVTNLAGPTNCATIGGQPIYLKYPYMGLLWRHASKPKITFKYV